MEANANVIIAIVGTGLTILLVIVGFLGFMMNGIYSRFSEASANLATTRTELGDRIETLGRDLRGEMTNMRVELNSRMDNLRDELHREHAGLDERLRGLEVRLGPGEPPQAAPSG